MEARLLVGATQHGWVTKLTHWLAEHGGAQLVGQALTPADIQEVEFDVLVLDTWSSLLTRRLVDQVQREGRAVLVLTNGDRPDAESARLSDLGVALSLPITAGAERIVSRAGEVAAVRRFIDHELEDPFPPQLADDHSSSSRLVVVSGHDGVIEVAVNLAASFVAAGPTALVDLDTVAPGIAQRLGLSIVPNVLTAADHVRRGSFGSESVSAHASGLSVLGGLANPREWDELGLVDAGELLDALVETFSFTVAVVNSFLEDLAPMSGLEGRFDIGRHAVEKADDVLVTSAGSPVGLVRALSTIADIRSLSDVPIHVVVNRMPGDGFLRTEWSSEFERTFTPASLWFLPEDPRVGRAAWDGRLPDRGPYAKAVRQMATSLLGERVP